MKSGFFSLLEQGYIKDVFFHYSDGFSLFCVNFWGDRRRKYNHITPALYNHHWLPVFYCIYFKILIITFKAIYNMSLSYISNLVSIKSCSVYSLRSNSS